MDGFKNAKFKGFKTLEEAQEYLGFTDQEYLGVTESNTKGAETRPQAKSETKPLLAKRAIGTAPQDAQSKLKKPRVESVSDIGSVPSAWSVMIGFDGGSRGNPGVAGSGAEVIVVERTPDGIQRARIKFHIREYLDAWSTNNMAEWKGALVGLKQLVDHVKKFNDENAGTGIKPAVKLVIQGDSQLVIRQLEGKYKVNNSKLKGYKKEYDSAIVLLKGMVSRLEISHQHVYRNDNGVADRKCDFCLFLFSVLSAAFSLLFFSRYSIAIYLSYRLSERSHGRAEKLGHSNGR